MSGAYYNEHDPKAAAWLRELVRRDLIAPGDVDERSILDIRPDELTGYTQCHFFAGIGVWSYALRRAGWPDDRPVWTGSCPCQPFSAAGKGGGFDDERHLWPAWHWLIGERRPGVVFGEQVASRDGLAWLDLVRVDMEAEGYAIGAVDLCAAGFGAPHIRQRLYFVADASGRTRERDARGVLGAQAAVGGKDGAEHGDRAVGLGDGVSVEFVADPERDGGRADEPERGAQGRDADGRDGAALARRPGATSGEWANCDWILCRDNRWRPIGAGLAPLASSVARGMVRSGDSGAPEDEISEEEANATGEARMMRLRGYGNSLCAETAIGFIQAYMKARGE